MTPKADAIDYDAHKAFFREVLQSIHDIMNVEYGLCKVTIKPLGASAARLSIPIKIEGFDGEGKKVKLFGKILGNSELMTAKAIQLVKNIYLQMDAKSPLFDINASAEQLGKHQYELLGKMHDLGIPTARPLGFHILKGNTWLLVEEFLDARPISDVSKITTEHLDIAFSYLAKMHKNGIYHGDIKPENIMFAEKVYIMDIGNFRDDAPEEDKKGYDLACQIASFLAYTSPEKIVGLATKHFSKKDLRHAKNFLELVQRRPDLDIPNDKKMELMDLMSDPGRLGKLFGKKG
jgi:tRNA A-37 threonylcarbamoyl transferase component Bud32